MGKGDRRHKKKSLPALRPVAKKQPNGRKRRQQGQVAERDPQRTVLEARARHMGFKRTDKRALRAQALAEDAGKAIYASLSGDDAEMAWKVYADFTAAEARYHARYTGLRLYAKTAKIEMAPERFEAREDDYVDLRSEEEKDRKAANDWQIWQGLLGHLPRHYRDPIYDVAYGRLTPYDAGGVTPFARDFVEGLQELVKVVERNT